ncbi:hypothetical protein F4804DRAFT_335331 [Jackrogersella minutella]|nr:hypothetical protein F4804DRAFT_335331 [Jackrogersella minutella]
MVGLAHRPDDDDRGAGLGASLGQARLARSLLRAEPEVAKPGACRPPGSLAARARVGRRDGWGRFLRGHRVEPGSWYWTLYFVSTISRAHPMSGSPYVGLTLCRVHLMSGSPYIVRDLFKIPRLLCLSVTAGARHQGCAFP